MIIFAIYVGTFILQIKKRKMFKTNLVQLFSSLSGLVCCSTSFRITLLSVKVTPDHTTWLRAPKDLRFLNSV